jgi:hypothetical protein
MRFEYTLIDSWPALAWLAKCSANEPVIKVLHGGQVETCEDWFCEAIWDGEYSLGNFDQTDIIYGSGARIRESEDGNGLAAFFVSSCTTLDRLQSIPQSDGVWVSNSLACLAECADASLDPVYPRYYEDIFTVCHGLTKYKRDLTTTAGSVLLTYFHNLKWDGQELTDSPKPNPIRDFSSFANFHSFLKDSLRKLNDNMSSHLRQHPYQMLGTLSNGYDSATITILAHEYGLKDVLSFTQARNQKDDSGNAVAQKLNLNVIKTSREDWRKYPLPEVPFLAADSFGEDVYFHSAHEKLKGRVLLTGHNGDSTWDTNNLRISTELTRTTTSGLSFAEYRLRAGFIHCTVPFLGIRQSADIHIISHSAEMKPWDVGGDYNRPICRRIIEEAGIPRGSFANHKSANSVLYYERNGFLSPNSLADYLQWIKQCSRNGIAHPCSKKTWQQVACSVVAQSLFLISNLAPKKLHRFKTIAYRFTMVERKELFRYVFPWALERAREAYRLPIAD